MSLEKQEKGTRNSSTQCPNLLTGKTIVFLPLTLKLTEVVTYRQSFSWDYSRMNDNIHQPKTFIAIFVIETCVLTMSCMYAKNIHGRRRTETFRSQIGKGWVLISPFGNVFYLNFPKTGPCMISLLHYLPFIKWTSLFHASVLLLLLNYVITFSKYLWI